MKPEQVIELIKEELLLVQDDSRVFDILDKHIKSYKQGTVPTLPKVTVLGSDSLIPAKDVPELMLKTLQEAMHESRSIPK